MSDRYPGGLIRKTPPTVTGPTDGEGGSAPGIWTTDQVAYYEKEGLWPKPILPRELYAWGDGSFGQIGNDDNIDISSPVQVGSLTTWEEVSAQDIFSAAIKSDGTYWYWGRGDAGRTGADIETPTNVSSPVQLGTLTNWSKVAGISDTMGAVKTDGTLWTWGGNSYGELGRGAGASTSSPIQVGSDTDWSDIVGGNECFFALKTTGAIYSWGRGIFGQTGLGSTADTNTPNQIGTDTDWEFVTFGWRIGSAIKTNGTLWTWGQGSVGGLGHNNTINYDEPTQVGTLTNWSKVAGGDEYRIAVKTDGTLWAWGSYFGGRLGTNDNVHRSSPVQVGALTNWADVFASRDTSFGVKTDGTLWAWGENEDGVLGLNLPLGITGYRSSPVQVGLETNWFKANGVTDGPNATILFITKG